VNKKLVAQFYALEIFINFAATFASGCTHDSVNRGCGYAALFVSTFLMLALSIYS